MKTVFVINKEAGTGKKFEKVLENIKKIAENSALDYEIYYTKSVGDAKEFVKNFSNTYGPARFIACGGDGTLNEVINGAIHLKENEIGVIPLGTGNDFCRNFDVDFFDVEAQFKGTCIPCDAIRYSTTINGNEKSGYGINMFNIGFDCNVVDTTSKIKKIKFISGPLAYFISIFITLIKKDGADLAIEVDGEIKNNGKLLLTAISNGCYYGGGIKCSPISVVNDGWMNINIIHNISRINFISKLPFYMKGTHPKLKGIEKIIYSKKCKNVVITPKNKQMRLCIDGEITDAQKTTLEVVKNAFMFVIPKK